MLSSKVKDKGSNPFPPEFFRYLNNFFYINMRINLNFRYDKLYLKEITILIPKYHTNMVSFLTPILEIFTKTGTITSKLINLVFISKSLMNSLTFIPYKPKIGVRNETILVWYLGIKIVISFK